ncbi:HK97 gp10 family phage protein [Lawsonibacter sp. JLR.KK007]|jgi:hypothetical protein|uniref:HK97 gp10 family phage protein n=1 Tax=Lawsonibacter sp. JLR.KK007 TaxID=3114293 RepID=UPI002FEE86E0
MSIQIDEFSLAVSEILDGYAEDIQEAVAQAVEETGTKALKTVKAKSPVRKGKGGGRYKKGWRIKKERSGVLGTQAQVTVYNKTDGPLVHLLENGHQKAGGGRVEGIPHVRPAYEEAERLLPELTARAIEEAGER